MIDRFLSGHISLHNQFVEQVFNTNPNYCCNLIYSCISYGCATLNSGAPLTHRLIFSCPHYHTLPSALFLPAYAPPCVPPAPLPTPQQKPRHQPTKVSTAPSQHPAAKHGYTNWGRPTSGLMHSDHSKITDRQDISIQTCIW